MATSTHILVRYNLDKSFVEDIFWDEVADALEDKGYKKYYDLDGYKSSNEPRKCIVLAVAEVVT